MTAATWLELAGANTGAVSLAEQIEPAGHALDPRHRRSIAGPASGWSPGAHDGPRGAAETLLFGHALVVDRGGKVRFCGEMLARWLGTAPAAIVGQAVEALLPGLTPDRLLARCGLAPHPQALRPTLPEHVARMIWTSRQAWQLAPAAAPPQCLMRANGASSPVDLSYGTLAGSSAGLLMLEVQQRGKQAQARLARLVHAAEQSRAPALITDACGTIEYVNPAFEARCGWFGFELAGHSAMLLEPPVAPPAGLAAALRARRPWVGRLALRERRGATLDEELSIRPVAIGGGPITHFVCLGRASAEPAAASGPGAARARPSTEEDHAVRAS